MFDLVSCLDIRKRVCFSIVSGHFGRVFLD